MGKKEVLEGIGRLHFNLQQSYQSYEKLWKERSDLVFITMIENSFVVNQKYNNEHAYLNNAFERITHFCEKSYFRKNNRI